MSQYPIPRASIWPNVVFNTSSKQGMADAQAWLDKHVQEALNQHTTTWPAPQPPTRRTTPQNRPIGPRAAQILADAARAAQDTNQ